MRYLGILVVFLTLEISYAQHSGGHTVSQSSGESAASVNENLIEESQSLDPEKTLLAIKDYLEGGNRIDHEKEFFNKLDSKTATQEVARLLKERVAGIKHSRSASIRLPELASYFSSAEILDLLEKIVRAKTEPDLYRVFAVEGILKILENRKFAVSENLFKDILLKRADFAAGSGPLNLRFIRAGIDGLAKHQSQIARPIFEEFYRTATISDRAFEHLMSTVVTLEDPSFTPFLIEIAEKNISNFRGSNAEWSLLKLNFDEENAIKAVPWVQKALDDKYPAQRVSAILCAREMAKKFPNNPVITNLLKEAEARTAKVKKGLEKTIKKRPYGTDYEKRLVDELNRSTPENQKSKKGL